MPNVFPPADMAALCAYFQGEWTFTRTIWEGAETPHATATGEINFTSAENRGELRYCERGQLQLLAGMSGRPILFSRVFAYHFRQDQLDVVFADGERSGQPYQSYLLRGKLLAPAADHLCGPDCYNAAYTLEGADGFSMETFIHGPKKRTRVLTACRRQATGLSASPA